MSLVKTPPWRHRSSDLTKTPASHTTVRRPETRRKSYGTDPACAELGDRSLEDQARARLHSSPYRSVQRVMCEVTNGRLILRGRVPSFYLKQIAQTVVRDLLHHSHHDGLVLDNRLEVNRT